ncbi:multiple sugar transport system substrate-binding protein [Monaibacterium marinum]|uniref:Multiple sugar transport system substrate-binding protein n=1 Tax=Pontivivens marinum TaxID=1690039 RepID=A0A2C9CPW7_9RHOB|nr:extracellular solute-binding protein [Monaibacterium marinum]SOH93292.1 multiple sugar transport system substrate-binding protein [Monaibacterium marinum]
MRNKLKSLILAGAATAALLPGAASADVEIEYWQYFFDARVEAMEQLIASFEEENPDITVTMTHFPYADYRTKVAAAIPAGEGPDVVQLFYGWLNDYIEAGLIQPLPTDTFDPDVIDAEFFPMVGAMKKDGVYYALPTAVRSLALFYNERLLEAAGVEPPTTLDELVEVAAATTERDGAGNITQVGITTGMTAQDHHWFREVLIRQFGGEPYLDDYQTVNYDTEAGRAALDYYTGLQSEHGVTIEGFMDEPQAAFKAGRAAMHIDGSFRIGSLADQRGLRWGVTELPAAADGTQSNYSSYWVNAITSKAEGEKLEAAVKFMEFITSDEAMQVWLDVVGELPAKPSVGMTDDNANDEVFGPFIRGLEYAHTTIFANESSQRQVLVDMVSQINIGGQEPGESLSEAAAAEQAILDDYYAD